MRRMFFLVPLLLVAASSPGSPPPYGPTQAADPGARVLAMLPPERPAQIPTQTINAVLRGDIAAQRFAVSLGLRPTVKAMGTLSELQAKQFIIHWLDHFTCLEAGIDDDIVNETHIEGHCSGQPMSDGPSAPFLNSDYYVYSTTPGAIDTNYWQAPTDAATGCTRTTNLSRYFVTKVNSPTTRSAQVWFGASDYFKLWINGVLVLSRRAGGPKPWTVDEYKADVTLVSGWNLIVVKQSFPELGPAPDPNEENKYKFFSLRFVSDDAGTPITDLVAAFDPGCTEADASIGTLAWVPNVAHTPGYASEWRTDLLLYNGTHMQWLYRLRFYKEGNNSGIPDGERYLQMAPFQTLSFPDALQSLFGITTDAKGYITMLQQLYFLWLSYAPQEKGWVRAKTFNQTASGTFGTSNPALYKFSSTLSAVTFFGLRNGAYRSNLALFPVVNTGATATIRLILSGPDLAMPLEKEYTAINGFWQLNNVFDALGAGTVQTDSATLSLQILDNPTGTAWFSYVTILDGNPRHGTLGTSDPIYVAPGYSAP
jgi:hypothetical protein